MWVYSVADSDIKIILADDAQIDKTVVVDHLVYLFDSSLQHSGQ